MYYPTFERSDKQTSLIKSKTYTVFAAFESVFIYI